MKKTLIVDDEEQARLYLAKILTASFPNMNILFAGSPAEAMIILEKQPIEMLFLDVEMPGMNGLDLLHSLREKQIDVPVIIVSAYNKVEFVKKALRLNVVDYLDKPVDPIELEAVVNKLITNGKTNGSLQDNNGTISSETEKISLPTDKGTMYVEPEKLLYFRANKRTSFVGLIDNEKEILVRDNLVGLEKKLSTSHFKRVSRQYIINLHYLLFVNRSKYLVLKAKNKEVKVEKIYPQIVDELTK